MDVRTLDAADVHVWHDGSLCLVWPLTPAAEEWITENVATPDTAPFFGRALVVEPRYLDDLVEGMRLDGLVVA